MLWVLRTVHSKHVSIFGQCLTTCEMMSTQESNKSSPKLRYLGSILRLVPCGWLPPVSGNHWDRTLAWASMPPEDSDQKHVFFLCTKFQSKILYTSFNKNWPFFLSWSRGNLGFSQLSAMKVIWKTPCQELARGDICSIDGLKVVVGW